MYRIHIVKHKILMVAYGGSIPGLLTLVSFVLLSNTIEVREYLDRRDTAQLPRGPTA